jgi:hypothetical protein
MPVVRSSPYENIYHCCTQKTGGQWFRAVFEDPVVYQYSGLLTFPYVKLGLQYAAFDRPLPTGTIGTSLYISYPTYLTIPKPTSYKTFFVLRDPRDIVVSWYFSARHSHVPVDPIPKMRNDLKRLSIGDGLKYIIDRLDEWGAFQARRSWMIANEDREKIALFRYEDLARDNRAFLRRILGYLDIVIPEEQFRDLYDRQRFETHSKGRQQGDEDQYSHYRKGASGDWRNHFDRSVMAYFSHRTGDLLQALEYAE